MTRGKVLQLGLLTFLIGAIGFGAFRFAGFEALSAGIASEALLVLLVIGWTGSYLFRVVSGKMTFMEQRKRYRSAYEQLQTRELKARFESMTTEEQKQLLNELDMEKDSSKKESD